MTTDAQSTDDVKVADAEAPGSVVKSLTKFLADHGEPASAVLQPVGRMGVRITLIGNDGVLGDQMVKDLDTARAVIDRFPQITVSEWSRDLVSVATPRAGHWAKMAGWVAKQTRFPKARNGL